MLILTRREFENIFINDDIEIKILSIVGKQVKLGINAPKNMKILREELYVKQKYNKEN